MMNKRGGLMDMPVNLLMLFIVVTFLVALIPGFVDVIDTAQQPDSLNCHGYRAYNSSGGIDWTLSANDSLMEKSSIGCMALKLYLPYIVLGVLITAVAGIIYGRSAIGGGGASQEQAMYG